jgi:hypothetical protein
MFNFINYVNFGYFILSFFLYISDSDSMILWTSVLLAICCGSHLIYAQNSADRQKTVNLNEPIVCDCGFEDENNNLWTDVWYADYGLYQTSLQHDPHYLVMDYTVGAKYKGTMERVFSPGNVKLSQGGGITLSVNQNSNGKYTSAAIGTKR